MKEIKNVVLFQPARFGDIIYVIPIARRLMERGYKVEFPVYKARYNGLNLGAYFPDINFTIMDPEHPDKLVHTGYVNAPMEGTIFLPLWNGANWKKTIGPYAGEDLMNCKYEMYNDLFEDNIDKNTYWHNLTWKRFPEKEKKLMEHLGVQPGEKYVLISDNYAWGHMDLKIETTLKKVYLRATPGFSMLDWSGLIEGADEIHCVDASTLYLVDRLITTDKLHRYRRAREDVKLSHLFSKKYIIHNADSSIYNELW